MTDFPDEVLPCGCFLKTKEEGGAKMFIVVACRSDCEYVQFVYDEARRQAKEIETRYAP